MTEPVKNYAWYQAQAAAEMAANPHLYASTDTAYNSQRRVATNMSRADMGYDPMYTAEQLLAPTKGFQQQLDEAFGAGKSPFRTHAQTETDRRRLGATFDGRGTHTVTGPDGIRRAAPGTYGSSTYGQNQGGVMSQLQGSGPTGNSPVSAQTSQLQSWLQQHYGGQGGNTSPAQGGGYAGMSQNGFGQPTGAYNGSSRQSNPMQPWAAGSTSQVPSFNGYTPTNGWNNRPSQGWDGWNTQGQTGGGLAGAVNNTGNTPANKGSRGGFYVGAPTGPRRTY